MFVLMFLVCLRKKCF
uniref:Uncharacterized protein n=1 Tax=Arundo donax TaxID=35708 RepID=A0A0A9BRX9_ARUDO